MKAPLTFEDTEYLESLKLRSFAVNHIHWDGSIPARDLFRFYQEKGETLYLPEKDLQGNKIADRLIDSPEKLREFQQGLLTKYDLLDVFKVPVGAMQSKEALKVLARAHCRYLKEHNIMYAETRFAPIYHTQGGLTLDQVMGCALDGFEEGEEETGVKVRPIVCINREADEETGVRIARAAINWAHRGVVGLDMACNEHEHPPEKHYVAYAETFDSPLRRTVHAGEMCDAEQNLRNVETAIRLLRADGIGHAIQLHQAPDLIELVVERGIRLESNPISNYNFFIDDIADLRLDYLVEQGVRVTINPDDPAMWPNGDLVHNLYVLGKLYGDEFIEKVRENSWETRWGQ